MLFDDAGQDGDFTGVPQPLRLLSVFNLIVVNYVGQEVHAHHRWHDALCRKS
jgi:hypothetical protein